MGDETAMTLTILPNPAKDLIIVESESKIQSIKVYSQTGQLVIDTHNPKIDISNLAIGAYFVLLT